MGSLSVITGEIPNLETVIPSAIINKLLRPCFCQLEDLYSQNSALFRVLISSEKGDYN